MIIAIVLRLALNSKRFCSTTPRLYPILLMFSGSLVEYMLEDDDVLRTELQLVYAKDYSKYQRFKQPKNTRLAYQISYQLTFIGLAKKQRKNNTSNLFSCTMSDKKERCM